MSRETFIYWKRKIMSLGIGLPDDQFIAYRPGTEREICDFYYLFLHI
jgi:hypothetical protein